MKDLPEFELRIVEALEPFSGEDVERMEQHSGKERAVTPLLAFEALKATRGSSEVLARFPRFGEPEAWLDTAYFSVCEQHGLAVAWSLVGVQSLEECRATFGEATPTTEAGYGGRVDLYFRAPTTGGYTMTAEFDSPGSAVVECRIDTTSFGQLPLSGHRIQPHVAHLGKGQHRFRIDQLYGAFSFLSMSIWTPPILAPN